MKLALSAILIAIGLAGFIGAQDEKPRIKETGMRVVLVRGNELYGWCTAYENTVTTNGENEVNFSGSAEESNAAMKCWAYIEAVVDGTPAGGEFSPGPNVRLSQYIDVAMAYLKDHANIRDQAAFSLVQNALRESFPRIGQK